MCRIDESLSWEGEIWMKERMWKNVVDVDKILTAVNMERRLYTNKPASRARVPQV